MASNSELRPAQWNITLYRGDTFTLKMRLQQDGVPIDLSNSVITAQVRSRANSTEVTAEFSVVQQTVEGYLELVLDSEQTQQIDRGVWDLKIQTGENVRTYLRGAIVGMRDVTR